MLGIGTGELVIIFLAIFLLFGPKSLPQIARKFGEILSKFNQEIQDFKKEVDRK